MTKNKYEAYSGHCILMKFNYTDFKQNLDFNIYK